MKATEAYNILKDIPEKQWTTGEFRHNGKCCSVGWLMIKCPYDYYDFWTETIRFMRVHKDIKAGIVEVNDGKIDLYPEPTPKARVLHLLEDMIKSGY